MNKIELDFMTQVMYQSKMTTPSADDWKAIAENYREKLETVEKKLQEVLGGITVSTEPTFSDDEMKRRVLMIETRTAYKSEWKRAVLQYNLLHNVQSILDECYDYFCDLTEFGEEFVSKAKKLFGKHKSLEWQLFTLKVIQYLWNKGAFADGRGGIDTFEDTAGGCDEILQEAVHDIILSS